MARACRVLGVRRIPSATPPRDGSDALAIAAILAAVAVVVLFLLILCRPVPHCDPIPPPTRATTTTSSTTVLRHATTTTRTLPKTP